MGKKSKKEKKSPKSELEKLQDELKEIERKEKNLIQEIMSAFNPSKKIRDRVALLKREKQEIQARIEQEQQLKELLESNTQVTRTSGDDHVCDGNPGESLKNRKNAAFEFQYQGQTIVISGGSVSFFLLGAIKEAKAGANEEEVKAAKLKNNLVFEQYLNGVIAAAKQLKLTDGKSKIYLSAEGGGGGYFAMGNELSKIAQMSDKEAAELKKTRRQAFYKQFSKSSKNPVIKDMAGLTDNHALAKMTGGNYNNLSVEGRTVGKDFQKALTEYINTGNKESIKNTRNGVDTPVDPNKDFTIHIEYSSSTAKQKDLGKVSIAYKDARTKPIKFSILTDEQYKQLSQEDKNTQNEEINLFDEFITNNKEWLKNSAFLTGVSNFYMKELREKAENINNNRDPLDLIKNLPIITGSSADGVNQLIKAFKGLAEKKLRQEKKAAKFFKTDLTIKELVERISNIKDDTRSKFMKFLLPSKLKHQICVDENIFANSNSTGGSYIHDLTNISYSVYQNYKNLSPFTEEFNKDNFKQFNDYYLEVLFHPVSNESTENDKRTDILNTIVQSGQYSDDYLNRIDEFYNSLVNTSGSAAESFNEAAIEKAKELLMKKRNLSEKYKKKLEPADESINCSSIADESITCSSMFYAFFLKICIKLGLTRENEHTLRRPGQ